MLFVCCYVLLLGHFENTDRITQTAINTTKRTKATKNIPCQERAKNISVPGKSEIHSHARKGRYYHAYGRLPTNMRECFQRARSLLVTVNLARSSCDQVEILSRHRFFGLPLFRFPSTAPYRQIFERPTSERLMCPNNFNTLQHRVQIF